MDAQENTMLNNEYEANRRSRIEVTSSLPPTYRLGFREFSDSSSDSSFEIPEIEEGSEMHKLLQRALRDHESGKTHKLR